MKRIYLFVLSALMMLMSTSAMAQSETVKGDVNGDGVVDVADIAAVIKIMTENGSIEKKYYWYAGQENPASMTSISPIVTDNTSPGWRLIGTTIPSYSASNMLWNENKGIIVTGESLAKQYVAIPAKSSACPRDGFGADASTVDIYTKLDNVTISGVEYKVYETVGKSRKYGLDTY